MLSLHRKIDIPCLSVCYRVCSLTSAVLLMSFPLLLLAMSCAAQDDRVRRVQDELVWAGYYDGMVDGVDGDMTKDATREFQKKLGQPPTGRLTPAQSETLHQIAATAATAVGFQQVYDDRTGITVGIPLKL